MARRSPHVVVVGAGAFGGWTALHLVEHSIKVTLIDAWPAGHLRGTSSGESRILRCSYGAKSIYTGWAWRALRKWKLFERAARTPLFVPSGVLWLCAAGDPHARVSLETLKQQKIPVERLSLPALRRRFPQFSTEGIDSAYFEPGAGFLRARLATQLVAAKVAEWGGRVLTETVEPPAGPGVRQERIQFRSGATLAASHFVFACGPWLPQVFPSLLGRRIASNKQEVFFFSAPVGDTRWVAPQLPPWVETSSGFYGVPSCDARGVKVADDHSGPPFDPTHGERVTSTLALENARQYLARRLPAMAGAPLMEARVCQYERTPDAHLVIDRHPQYENVWLAGGGSGHGFKLGPMVGAVLAGLVLGKNKEPLLPEMRLGASAWPAGMETPQTFSF